MTSVGYKFSVDVHMALTPPPVHRRPPEPDPLQRIGQEEANVM